PLQHAMGRPAVAAKTVPDSESNRPAVSQTILREHAVNVHIAKPVPARPKRPAPWNMGKPDHPDIVSEPVVQPDRRVLAVDPPPEVPHPDGRIAKAVAEARPDGTEMAEPLRARAMTPLGIDIIDEEVFTHATDLPEDL